MCSPKCMYHGLFLWLKFLRSGQTIKALTTDSNAAMLTTQRYEEQCISKTTQGGSAAGWAKNN